MPDPSLFPMFMNPLGGGGGGTGGGDIVVELMAEPEIVLEPDVDIQLEPDAIDIELEPDAIDIELEPELEIEVE